MGHTPSAKSKNSTLNADGNAATPSKPKKAKVVIPELLWGADNGAKTYKFIGPMENYENFRVLFGKQDSAEVRKLPLLSYLLALSVFQRIGKILWPVWSDMDQVIVGTRYKNKFGT